MPRCNANNTKQRQLEAVKRQAQLVATSRTLRAEREKLQRLAEKQQERDKKHSDQDNTLESIKPIESVKPIKTVKIAKPIKATKPTKPTKPTEATKPARTLLDYSQTNFVFTPKEDTDQSIFCVALEGLDTMFVQYIMYLVLNARGRLIDIIRAKDSTRMSFVDIDFDPFMPFDVKAINDDGTETLIHKEAHELLYGSMCESGEWKGHWMKFRKNYFSALSNFNKIQCKVFAETGFYLTDVSVDKNKVSLVLANRFGQFQLTKQNKGYRFWHKHVFLPSSVFATLNKQRDTFLDDAPEFIYVLVDEVPEIQPVSYDSDDLEDEDNFVREMTRTTRF